MADTMHSQQQISSTVLSPSPKRIEHLKAIARSNCLNDSSKVEFNKYGKKDEQGFVPVSSIFISSVQVHRATVEGERQMLDSQYLWVFTQRLKHHCSSLKEVNVVTMSKNNDATFKWNLECSEASMDQMMAICNAPALAESGFVINSFVLTRDYAGSFDRKEIVQHFTDHCNLKEEFDETEFYIDNSIKTDATCFDCKKQDVQYTMFLKFPQMLQGTTDLAYHWIDWCQKSNSAINTSAARGLTRIELTCKAMALETMLSHFADFVMLIPAQLSYATPHSAMWRAYADCLHETLIVVDEEYETKGLAILVYSHNSHTNQLCGITIKNWATMSHHAITRLTLASKLPIHVLSVSSVECASNEEILTVQGAIYSKTIPDNVDDATFMTNSNGTYAVDNVSQSAMDAMGFIPHENCHLKFSPQRIFQRTKMYATFQRVGSLIVQLDRQIRQEYNDSSLPDTLFPCNVHSLPTVKLRSLKRGLYNIHGIIMKKYPILLMNYNGALCKLFATNELKAELDPTGSYDEQSPDAIAQLHLYSVGKPSKNCGQKTRKVTCELTFD